MWLRGKCPYKNKILFTFSMYNRDKMNGTFYSQKHFVITLPGKIMKKNGFGILSHEI